MSLDDGDVPIHDIYVESIIRSLAQGRRVWPFANNPFGARANGLGPPACLTYLFEQPPAADTVEALNALCPGTLATCFAAAAAPPDATHAATMILAQRPRVPLT